MKKNVFLFGATGRMGQELQALLTHHPTLQYVGGFSRSHPVLSAQKQIDVVIDFSLPETQPQLLDFLDRHPAALVSGTTGLNIEQKNALKKIASTRPVFWSANMSFGVYLLCRFTEQLARYQNLYRYHIEETHHIHKKDKPSGTALLVADAAAKTLGTPPPVESFREGEVFGIHHFIAESTNERITVSHEAFNRTVFAQGALDVAVWLIQQKAGDYTMDDFYNSMKP